MEGVCVCHTILANVHFSPLKFQKVVILAPYLKNYNFGPFHSKIAEKAPRVPKKGHNRSFLRR